jgi:hypothetical protein
MCEDGATERGESATALHALPVVCIARAAWEAVPPSTVSQGVTAATRLRMPRVESAVARLQSPGRRRQRAAVAAARLTNPRAGSS